MLKGKGRTLIDALTRETVVVHAEGDESIKGVLFAVYEDCVVLRHAVRLWDGGETKVDGEAVVPLGRVLWMQRLEPDEVPR